MEHISTDKAPKAGGPYSQATKHCQLIFTAGQVGLQPNGTLVNGGIAEQTTQAIQNLKNVLEEAGSSLDKALKVTVFLTNMDDYTIMNNVYSKHFTNKPARSTVAVKTLPLNVLVEIDVVATV